MKLRGASPVFGCKPCFGAQKKLSGIYGKCEEDLADGYGTVGKANEVLSGD